MALDSPGGEAVTVYKTVYPDKNALYSAYMSFVKGGGLFVATQKMHKLGEKVKLEVQFMEEKERFHIDGKVIWITPLGAQGNRIAGIGVQFMGDESGAVRNKIEGYLVGALKSERPTNTM